VAGYDISVPGGIEELMELFAQEIGLEHLHAFHFNDSKGAWNSHLDRHAHIGEGNIGEACFKWLVNEYPHLPKIVETNHDGHLHLEDLRKLRAWSGKA
jgi:deoxyribonuclease-4